MAGKNRRQTDLIVVSQTDTHARQNIGVTSLVDEYQRAGIYSDRGPLGVHFLIRRSGAIEIGRDLSAVGQHPLLVNESFDEVAVHVALVGGVDMDGVPEDNFGGKQLKAMADLCRVLFKVYPSALVCPISALCGRGGPSYDIYAWEDSIFGSGHESRVADYLARHEQDKAKQLEKVYEELDRLFK